MSFSGDQPFASQTPLTPFFRVLGVSQRLPPRTRAVATSGDQQFVDQTLTPLLAFSSGLRMLVLGLILVALLPKPGSRRPFLAGRAQYALVEACDACAERKSNASDPVCTTAPPCSPCPPLLCKLTAGEEVTLPITLDGG